MIYKAQITIYYGNEKTKETYLVKLQFLTHNEFYPENSCAWLDRVECAAWYVVE